jgi:hypothetical protein
MSKEPGLIHFAELLSKASGVMYAVAAVMVR